MNEARENPDEADHGRLPDEMLLARARNEDAALGALLERIRPLVRRWALVATGDVDAAADVTQRVLLSVHRSPGDVRGDGGFRAWLYRLTANAAADEHRTRRLSERLRDAMLRHHALQTEAPADVQVADGAATVFAASEHAVTFVWLNPSVSFGTDSEPNEEIDR